MVSEYEDVALGCTVLYILLEIVIVFNYLFVLVYTFEVESEFGHVNVRYLLQFTGQQLEIPGRKLGRFIISQSECFDLFVGQIVRDYAGHFVHACCLCRLESRVAGNNNIVFVDHDRDLESEFTDGSSDLLHRVIILARVLFVWDQVCGFLLDDLHLFLSPWPISTKNQLPRIGF